MQRTALVVLVGASYLLFAGSPAWSAAPLLLLAVGAVLTAPRRTLAFPRTYRSLDWSLAAIVMVLIVQLIPMPRAAVSLMSPQSAEARARLGLMAMVEGPENWAPLSIDAAATAEAVSTVVLAVLTFWVARAGFTARGGTRGVCQALAFMGAAAAMLAIAQRNLIPGLVLGVLPPDTPSASPFGAFVNRNHFAGWLLMIAATGGGYLIAHVQVHSEYGRGWVAALREALRTGSILTAMALTISVGALFMTVSRSALAGLGAAAVWGWLVVRARVEMGRQTWPMWVAFAGAALLVVVLFVDIDRWAARIASSFEPTQGGGGRITIWRESMPIVQDFPLIGTGAGTYSDAMILYQQTRTWVGSMAKWLHFNNAHSHYLQVAVEGGILLALPVATGLWSLAMLARRSIATARGEIFWVRAGAAAGLLGIAVQSLWEVSLVMPANAVLAAVVAALAVHERPDVVSGSTTTTSPSRPGNR